MLTFMTTNISLNIFVVKVLMISSVIVTISITLRSPKIGLLKVT